MSAQDIRAIAIARKGRMGTSGKMVVMYREASGAKLDAVVLGGGSVSGIKIQLMNTQIIVDNVQKITGLADVGYETRF